MEKDKEITVNFGHVPPSNARRSKVRNNIQKTKRQSVDPKVKPVKSPEK